MSKRTREKSSRVLTVLASASLLSLVGCVVGTVMVGGWLLLLGVLTIYLTVLTYIYNETHELDWTIGFCA